MWAKTRAEGREPHIPLLADPSRRRERSVGGGSNATDAVLFYYSKNNVSLFTNINTRAN